MLKTCKKGSVCCDNSRTPVNFQRLDIEIIVNVIAILLTTDSIDVCVLEKLSPYMPKHTGL